MTLFLSLLPIYLFGNLHCAGMCGPLMMLLAKNRYRWAYFLGRICSYSLAGLLTAAAGMLFFQALVRYHAAACISIGFGCAIIALACCTLFKVSFPWTKKFAQYTIPLSNFLASLIARHGPYPLFFFGMCTLLLPCGQTLIVFSACALEANPLTGCINGILFALLTSPALLLSMRMFKRISSSYHVWMGCATLLVGVLALFRGLADLDVISHLIVNPSAPTQYHIVLW